MVGLTLGSWTGACLAEISGGDNIKDVAARVARLTANHPLGKDFQHRTGIYTYDVIWRSSKVATVSIIADRADDTVITAIRAETTDDFDKVLKVRFQGVAKIVATPFKPVKTVMRERVQSMRKSTTVDFRDDGTLEVREEKVKKGKPRKVRILDTMLYHFWTRL